MMFQGVSLIAYWTLISVILVNNSGKEGRVDVFLSDCKSLAPYRFWRGLYNRFDRGMHPRQSVEDYLSTIQEETQQLEEQLASHKQVGQGYKSTLLVISHENKDLLQCFPWL